MNEKYECTKGTMIISEDAEYFGELNDRSPNGYGTLTLSTGTRYQGNWEHGKLSGKVSLRFSNGDEYVGHIKDKKPDGMGTFTWASGKSYRGKWINGMYSENGIFQPLRNTEPLTGRR